MMGRRENGAFGDDDDDDDDDDGELHIVFMAAPWFPKTCPSNEWRVANLAPLRNIKSLHLANMHASEITND